MIDLKASNLCAKAGDAMLVTDASFNLKRGEFVALLGPNGAGKTSLLRACLGLAIPSAGSAMIGGTEAHTLSPIERAQRVSYLPQTRPLAWPIRVRDVVALGRFSHGAAPGNLKGADAEAVDHAITSCDLGHLDQRNSDTLSGGELARVHCARAFAAKAPLLIADEPIAALDPRHQFRILNLIKDFVDQGGGALVVLHDIALAARYATRLIWMNEGRLVADGAPAETLSAERIQSVYGVKAQVSGVSVEIEGPA